MPLAVSEIASALRGRRVGAGIDLDVTGVTIDSRAAKKGELFFAIRGENTDGHRFLADAARAGCAAAVVAEDAALDPAGASAFGAGWIVVRDTTRSLGELGGIYRDRLGGVVIGVTGSNGKTTVKRMAHHILGKHLRGTCSPKSFNNQWGLPLTLLAADVEDEYVVCEIGSNAPGEIAALSRLARPDVAVITCISPTHLEKLGSLEVIAAEKASLLGWLAPGGLAIAWADSELLAREMRPYNRPTQWFGEAPDADLRITRREALGWTQRFEVNGEVEVSLGVPGRHNAINALAALAIARRMGLTLAQAAAALADYTGDAMRLQRHQAGRLTVINDAYNANPASYAAAADVLAGLDAERKVLIAGDMRELGSDEVALHLQIGRRLAGGGVDLLIGVGRLGRYIAQGAAEEGTATATFDSAAEALDGAAALLRPGDLVLVKASRAMALERLIEPILSSPAAREANEPDPDAKGASS